MEPSRPITRRAALATLAGAAAVGLAAETRGEPAAEASPLKGKFKQSVCKWCYPRMSLDELCRHGRDLGLQSVELLGEKDWATVQKYGLTCAVANGPSGITDGWNRVADHDRLVRESERLLPLIAEAKLPQMIVFSGNRRG